MANPTRFPNGITNTKNGPLSDMGQMDPTQWHTYFEDFDYFNSGDWTITTTEAGTGTASEALTDEDGGVLLITNDDADNDLDNLAKVGESFLFESGKRTFAKVRLKVSDATESDVFVGLIIKSATDPVGTAPTDGVFFRKDDGDTDVDFVVTKDSTATTSTGVTTLADDTYIELAFYYDGSGNIQVWADGSIVDNEVSADNLPDDEALTPMLHIQNGEGAAKTMSVDYIFVAKQR